MVRGASVLCTGAPQSPLRKPARQARLLAKLARAPERNILGDLSTGAQGKRSQQTSLTGVAAECSPAYVSCVRTSHPG